MAKKMKLFFLAKLRFFLFFRWQCSSVASWKFWYFTTLFNLQTYHILIIILILIIIISFSKQQEVAANTKK